MRRYTRRQLVLFYDAALRREKNTRADRLEELALARGSGQKIKNAMNRWRSK